MSVGVPLSNAGSLIQKAIDARFPGHRVSGV